MPLLVYILVAYGCTWGLLIPLSGVYATTDPVVRTLWHTLGSLGPTLGALVAVATQGKQARRQFLASVLRGIQDGGAWAWALAPLVVGILVLFLGQLLRPEALPTLSDTAAEQGLRWPGDGLVFLLPAIAYGILEEVGWRGWLLPRLQQRFSARAATGWVALIWLCWHGPMFGYRFNLEPWMLPGFAISLFAGAVVLTYLWNRTHGSLPAVALWHLGYDVVAMSGGPWVAMVVSFGVIAAGIYCWRQLPHRYSKSSFSH
ncbi:MAG: CPBP family intramembrane glutamic endopeptidase [Bacteroidia bacterium]|nr:CPBP family intramembrane glutamic endopeptidase [Bacteroidia bacterium]